MRPKSSAFPWICIALVAVTILSYWPVVSSDFVSIDDAGYVSANNHVIEGLSRSGWWYAWTTNDCANWHPFTWLSLELDGCFWGRNPTGYHATNLAFHIANSVLLLIALCQMTNRLIPSACIAGFFALHPLHVESVAWISERKDVLSTFCLLLAIISYVHYAARPSRMRYVLVSLFFVLGLLAKPMLVTLPIQLFLLDIWPLRRLAETKPEDRGQGYPCCSVRMLFLEKIPLLVLAFCDGLITIFAQREATRTLSHLTLVERIGNAFYAYVWYLRKTLVPTNLMAFYPHPQETLSRLDVTLGILVVLAITMLVVWRRRTTPYLFVGWLWFVVSLLPVIGLLQVGGQAYADRYAYIPHIGLFMAIIWQIHTWAVATRMRTVVATVAVIASLAECALLTRVQVEYWKNSACLWGHAVDVDPDNFFAHEHLVDVRMAEGDFEKAAAHCERVVHLNRSWDLASTYCNWGRCLIALNRFAEAESKFLAALQIAENHEVSLYELSELLRKEGRHDEAVRFADQHLALSAWRATNQPEKADSQMAMGLALVRQGNPQQALIHFEKAAQLAPSSAEALGNLGMVQIQMNRLDQAKSSFLRAIKLNPNLAAIHFCLGQILEREHDLPGAKKHFAEALRINPADQDAKNCLERLSKL